MQGFWNRLGEMGVEFNPFQGAFAQQVVVAETDDQAEQMYTEHLQYFFDKCLHVYPGFADAPGYRTENTIRAGLRAGGAQGLGIAHTLEWKDWVREGYIVAGSPDSVTEQIEALATKLQVGHLVTLLHCGDMPDDKARASTKLFAEQVMPRVKHIWEDYEDHWSPKPIGVGACRDACAGLDRRQLTGGVSEATREFPLPLAGGAEHRCEVPLVPRDALAALAGRRS